MRLISETEVHLDLEEFINGRLSMLPTVKGSEDQRCNPGQKAAFRSAVGNLHWVSSQTRPDCSVYTSRLHKVQNDPSLQDYGELAKVLRELRETADVVLKVETRATRSKSTPPPPYAREKVKINAALRNRRA